MIELKGSRIPREDSKSCCAKCQCEVSTPDLLTIELTDEESIPRIVYKGEDVTALIAVDFEWSTRDDKQIGSTYFRIKHANIGSKKPVVETKELAVGERAYGA
ncbi:MULTISPECIES: hypothetical protein [Bacillus amyloliquefaciens group]|uniref:hypothetical protein n=1 Tax=Bacillus amyloliquefaciens group TaxID=1938374 RepID=UPI00266F6AFC|nr:hypothetical protein [Bacillus amyloliquefaciens]WKT37481.1 hypothetical protein Q2B68_07400 [Bacillus amyloliquefaciens]WKT37572.1 hypothetical protein Q2B68_07870 [Bacillus amyloliquefaciens]